MFKRNATGLFFVLILLIAFSGCDQVQSFTKYFSSKTDQQENVVQKPKAKPQQAAVVKTEQIKPNVLAKAGDWTLSIEDFNQRITNLKQVLPDFDVNDLESKKIVLEELVRQQLLVMDAEKTGLAKKKEIVDAIEEFRMTILVREAATKIVEGIEASEEDAKAWYDANKELLVEPAQWKVREIVASTQVGAKDILVEVLQGNVDFAQVAKERSVSKSAAKGGDLGFIAEASFGEMNNVLMTLESGDVSSVFRGPEGFYIIKVEEKKGGQQKEFDELKEEIIGGVTIQMQQEALIKYIDEIEKNTKVYKNEKLLEQ